MRLTAIVLAVVSALYCVNANKVVREGVSPDEIDLIVAEHNRMRLDVANGRHEGLPEASNMKRMVWDEDLAAMAQKYVKKMKCEHNEKRKDQRYRVVGENFYTSYKNKCPKEPEADWSKPTKSWFDEHHKYKFGPFNKSGTGHFTQIVWANTDRVGCGYISWTESDGTYKDLYLCDYGPGGNIHGECPYEVGPGCEDLC